jgi:MFS superfamily sulfate permease-like transporter
VEQGIVLAIVASVVDHLRHSYSPLNSILVKSPEGHWQATPVTAGARTEPGLAVYRFGTSLYYANAARLVADITAVAGHDAVDGPVADRGPLRWLVIDWTAIGDVDYTAAGVLAKVVERLHEGHVRLVFTSVLGPVRNELGRYGISPDAWYDTPGEALEAFSALQRPSVGGAAAADVVDGASGEADPIRGEEGD